MPSGVGLRETRGRGRLPLAALCCVWAAATPAQRFQVRGYTTENGLPASQVWDIHQDRRGFLWFATSEGVSRLDGDGFATITAADGLGNPGARTILEAPDGSLWFGTNGGVTRYDGRTLTNYTDKDGLGPGAVWASAVDARGRLWFGTQGGLSRWDGARFRNYTIADGLVDNYIYALHAGRDGALWTGFRAGGVIRWALTDGGEPGAGRRYGPADGLPAGPVRAIAEDESGAVFVGVRHGGLAKFDGVRFRAYTARDGIGGMDLYGLLVTRRGELAIAAVDGGVTICALPAVGPCRRITRRNGLQVESALSVEEDREGTLWIGLNNGVTHLLSERIEVYTEQEGLANNSVYSLLADPDGTVWFGTYAGLTRRTPVRDGPPLVKTWSLANGALSADQIWSVARDRAGRFWFASDGGLCLLENEKPRCFTERDGLISRSLSGLHFDRAGRLWMTTVSGVDRMDPYEPGRTPRFRHYTRGDGLAGEQAMASADDAEGNVWIATADGGLNRLAPDGAITNYRAVDGLGGDNVSTVFVAADGTVWAGVNGGGLARYEKGSVPPFRHWKGEDGLADSVLALTDGSDGRLWVGTSRGVFLVQPRGAEKPEVIMHIDRRRGLADNEVTTASAMIAAPGGGLWIGTKSGATRLLPSRNESNPLPETVITRVALRGGRDARPPFTAVGADGGGWPREGPLTVRASENEMRIEFRALAAGAPGALQYQVRLAGFSEPWSDAGIQQYKEYTNLDPGRYRFEVRSKLVGGEWGPPAALPLQILPAWWQSLPFRLALLLAAGLAVILIIRWRTRAIRRHNEELAGMVAARTAELEGYSKALESYSHQLERANLRIEAANRMKSRFLATMSHELRTPLNSIIGFTEILRDRSGGKLDERERKFLNNVHESAHLLLGLINNLLDLSKIEAGKMEVYPDRIHLHGLIEAVRAIMSGMAGRKGIELVNECPEALPPVEVDGAKVKQSLFNLLSNAIKFSSDGSRVEIGARRVAAGDSPLGVESVEIRVTDHGIGIEPGELKAIFEEFRQVGGGVAAGGTGLGLAIVRRFAEIQGGTVDVESEPGRGSTFRLILPAVVVAPPGEGESGRLGARIATRAEGKVVMVVEDDPAARDALSRELLAEGYEVVAAAGGEEALQLAQQIRPSVIALDIILPGQSGWEVLRALKDDPNLADIAVVITSVVESRELGLALGADDFFTKPVDMRRLLGRVRQLALRREGTGATVLLVDDDPQVAELIGPHLETGGYTLVATDRGKTGLDLARTLQPAVIILDLMMPGMNGFEVAAALQNEAATSRIPIIVLTARELTAAERELLRGKAAVVLAKGEEARLRLLQTIRSLDRR